MRISEQAVKNPHFLFWVKVGSCHFAPILFMVKQDNNVLWMEGDYSSLLSASLWCAQLFSWCPWAVPNSLIQPGSPFPVKTNDPEVQRAARLGVYKYNNSSNDIFLFKESHINKATVQKLTCDFEVWFIPWQQKVHILVMFCS
ncbi:hypothetical protein E2320_016903 [Naja naja]|nr:hypothetical protein E2320_016903 [Naja naja]